MAYRREAKSCIIAGLQVHCGDVWYSTSHGTIKAVRYSRKRRGLRAGDEVVPSSVAVA
jgi:hypothetical protein